MSFIHGESSTRIFSVWRNMIYRCYKNKYPNYKDYGGRGIRVCNEWRTDFFSFRSWAISHGYQDNLEIDRKNNDGNHEPGNCRFVTHKVNSINRRNSRIITAFGESKSLAEWSYDNRCVVSYRTLMTRINNLHWNAELAIVSQPSSIYKPRKKKGL